jgi:prophage maintenance system killer protein
VVSFPLNGESKNKIESLVANINGTTFGVERYETVEEKIVAYLYFIIKNHPFTDGNKRTAVLVFLVLSRMNDLRQHLENYDLDALAIFLEKYQGEDHQKLIRVVAETIFSQT